MGKIIVWVCRICTESFRTPEGHHPDEYISECKKGIGIHDWQPVSVEGEG